MGTFIAYCGERVFKAIRDILQCLNYFNRTDNVRKIWDRKQRRYIGNYSFVNRVIKTRTNSLQKD